MDEPLRVLILEDNVADAELMKRELRKGGLNFTAELAQNRGGFVEALDRFTPDIVLADYSLPEFDGLSALKLAQERSADIPVIIVSGAIGEETAIETMKAGATDYVLKDRLKRLMPVVERALDEAKALAERKNAEETVRQLAQLLRLSFDAIIVWRLDGGIETWNRGAEELYGYAEDEVLAQVPVDVLKTRYPVPWPEIERILQERGRWEGELRHATQRGTEVTVFARLQLVRRPDGHEYVLEINRDITERKKAREVLQRDRDTLEKLVEERTQELLYARQEMERAKHLSDIGTLAATVAHELRNPLATIGMAAYNIKRKVNLAEVGKHVSDIEKKVAESDQIISNLLFYSRIKPPCQEVVDLGDLLGECIEEAEKRSEKAIRFAREFECLKNVPVEVDPVQIKEVFNNILNNAVDAVPDKCAQVKVGAGVQGDVVQVTIEDNGPGIAEDIVAKVFDPFFTTKSKGTGLGLSICRQVVSLHEGDIGLESEPGRGTTVIVRLPKKTRRRQKTPG